MFGSVDQKVYALKTSDGTVRWSFATGNYVYSSPAVSSDGATVFAVCFGKVYALAQACDTTVVGGDEAAARGDGGIYAEETIHRRVGSRDVF